MCSWNVRRSTRCVCGRTYVLTKLILRALMSIKSAILFVHCNLQSTPLTAELKKQCVQTKKKWDAMCSRHGYSQPSKPHSSAPKREYGKTWYMVRPFIDRKAQSRGATSQTTSALASADLELVNAMGTHHWNQWWVRRFRGRGQTLRKKDPSTNRVFYISWTLRLGYCLDKQSVLLGPFPLPALRTQERLSKSRSHAQCPRSLAHPFPTHTLPILIKAGNRSSMRVFRGKSSVLVARGTHIMRGWHRSVRKRSIGR